MSSFVIRKLIEDAEKYLEETVEEVIVSVPAYFNDAQRYATKLAGHFAGVRIDRIINEPSAAALAQQSHLSIEDQSFIVVDFGGGTLDISVVESFDNVVEIIAIAGDNRLGGEDFTRVIAREFLQEQGLDESQVSKDYLNKVLVEAEKAKIGLNTKDAVRIEVHHQEQTNAIDLTYQRFYEICQPLLARVKDVLDRALFDANQSDVEAHDFVLVGGTSKLRLVQEFLSFCVGQVVQLSEDPDLMIAKGCALVAGIKARQGEVKDILLSDICPFTLGTEMTGDRFSPIIERNSSLPASHVNYYQTSRLGQEKVMIGIYQGERMKASENFKLGELVVPVPVNHSQHELISVRFTYDLNGILDVEVKVESTGQVFNKVILQESVNLTEQEIAEKQAELAKYKFDAQDTEVYRFLMEKAERLYGMLLGQQREQLMRQTEWFKREVKQTSVAHLPKLYRTFSDYLNHLEHGGVSQS